MTWATPNAETENVRSISEMVGATVATVASNSITHPVRHDRVFLLPLAVGAMPSGTPNHMQVYKSIPTRDK